MSDAVRLSLDTVMVVDDSPVQRRHAVTLCRELGIATIHEAADGQEALTLLDRLSPGPQAVLVDLEMPGMDGVEFLEALCQREGVVPVLLVSSREPHLIDAVHTLSQRRGLPMLGALRKPLQRADLQAMLSQPAPRATERARGCTPAISAQDLQTALSLNQIGVHFQPKVDMRSAMVRGVEALARWKHPDHGFIGPDQFIPLAEQSGLIGELTRRVANLAMAQTRHWDSKGLRLSLALNLSPLLLSSCPQLVEELSGLARQHALETPRIVIEVTEGALASDAEVAVSRLARLRLRGFGLSIDDYGTGYSSMQQLGRIPFSELKIDRSFVHGAPQRPHLQVILRSALDMTRHLGLVSVAEGIETLEDWRLLQALGCDVGQGWLIGRPMPGDQLLSWLQQHRSRLSLLRHPDTSPDA